MWNLTQYFNKNILKYKSEIYFENIVIFVLQQHYPETLYNRYYNANGEIVEEEGTNIVMI